MPTIRVNDLDVYYETCGRGFPVILIMGLSANVDWWPSKFLDLLLDRFKLVMFDNRGAGRTRGDSSRFTTRQAARDAFGLMDALGISEAHVVGISMGGMIAQEMALQQPQRIRKLVLGASSCGMLRGAAVSRHTLRLLCGYLREPVVRARPRVLNLLFTQELLNGDRQITREFIRRAGIAPISTRAWLHQIWAIVRFDSYARLRGVRTPTLVVTGTDDVLLPARNSEILANRIPHSTLVKLDGLGHGFIAEAADLTGRITLEFLAQSP